MKFIPNLVTLINLFAGTVAIVLSLRGLPQYAALVIMGCMVLDWLDGALARLLDARSSLGMQLDSLADLVSFGIAPATIVFHYLSVSIFQYPEGFLKTIVPFVAFIIPVFAAIRLARFNIEDNKSDSFSGLPTPACAFFFASWPIVLHFFPSEGFVYATIIEVVTSLPKLVLISLFFSLLMVSRVPMFSLKIYSLSFAKNKTRYMFAAIILASFLILGMQALALVIVFYIILSLSVNLGSPQ